MCFFTIYCILRRLLCMMNMEDKTKILFVCLGNICRSPAAEGIMKAKLEDLGLKYDYYIDSAGIGSWHAGQLPDYRMRECGNRHGYVFNSRARQVKSSDFDDFDYVIGMDNENMHDLKSLARTEEHRRKVHCMASFMKNHPAYKTIPDPYYGDTKDFELAVELIEDACEGLIRHLQHFN